MNEANITEALCDMNSLQPLSAIFHHAIDNVRRKNRGWAKNMGEEEKIKLEKFFM